MNAQITPIVIGNTEVLPLFFRDQPVITLAMMDQVHSRPEGTARKRFNDNKEKLIEDEDYFVRLTDEAKAEFNITAPNGLIILTETGYLLLVKSFTDELAWKIQRQLVKAYFGVKHLNNASTYPTISEHQKQILYQAAQQVCAELGWIGNEKAAYWVINGVRAIFNINKIEDLPENLFEAALAHIRGKKDDASAFLTFINELRREFMRDYLGNSAPWTPALRKKYQAQTKEKLSMRVDWVEVQKKLINV